MIKKLVISLLSLSLIFVVIVFFFGSKILGTSVKKGVETFGPKITKTDVRLDTVELSVLSGNGKLEGLYVANPQGFSSDNIFVLSKIDVDIEARSLLSDRIVINRIYIKEPQISYEKTLRTSNLKELLKNIEGEPTDKTDEITEPEPEESADTESPAKEIFIGELIIESPTAFLGIMGVGRTVTFQTIQINDITGNREQIMADILGLVIKELLEQIRSAAPEQANPVKNVLNSILSPNKNSDE